jgi:hypothetical protein
LVDLFAQKDKLLKENCKIAARTFELIVSLIRALPFFGKLQKSKDGF